MIVLVAWVVLPLPLAVLVGRACKASGTAASSKSTEPAQN